MTDKTDCFTPCACARGKNTLPALWNTKHSYCIEPHYAVHCLVGPQLSDRDLSDLISALKEITKPHDLGIHLGIETHVLDMFEENYQNDVNRRKTEVLKHWLRNSTDCTWGALASAVEKMGGHGNLVKRLRDKHRTL